MTAAALATLQAELAQLETVARQEIAERIKTAREWGDLKENSEYHDAKNDQAHLETKILRVREQLLEKISHGLGSFDRQMPVRRETDCLDRRVVGMSHHPDFARFFLQRRRKSRGHRLELFKNRGLSGFEQDQVADPDDDEARGLIGRHLLSRAAIAYLLANRFQTVLWNSVPGDWRDAAGWVDTCIAEVLEKEWSVVVLHDIENGCLPHLSELLQRLNDLGAVYEQDFPDSVIVTRAGKTANLSPEYVSD